MSLQDDSRAVAQLAKVLLLCNVENPSVANIVVGLDHLISKERKVRQELEEATRLNEKSSSMKQRVEQLKRLVTRAKEDFVAWARQDCEERIQELLDARETVLLKKDEYRNRLAVLKVEWEKVRGEWVDAACLQAKLDEYQSKVESLKQIQLALEPYNQLPPDPTLAMICIEEAKQRLANLTRQRDQLLRTLCINR